MKAFTSRRTGAKLVTPGDARALGRAAVTLASRLNPVAAACAAVFSVAAGNASAQTAPAPQAASADAQNATLETIVVSGIRGSIEKSIQAKRDSDSIIEAISAEDIGKLPDLSIAESLGRLPGVAAQRVNGHAQVLSIRGMSEDFAGTLLNGREQTTTGLNRGVEFDQYPAELMSGAVVYKTPDATLLGQGLSGTVDLHTIRPLELSGMILAVNARGEHNSLGALNGNYGDTSANGERLSLAYVNQFADHTFGVSLGIAYLNAPEQEQHYKAWWWGAPGSSFFNGATAQGGAEAEALSRRNARTGLMSTLEFKPNKDVHSTLDLYYSKFNETEVMRGLMWDSNPWAGYPITNPGYTNVGGTTLLTSGTIAFPAGGAQPVVRNDYNTRDDHLKSVGWNNEVDFEGFKAIADLSYSSARRQESLFETYAGVPTSSIAFNIPGVPAFASFAPSVNFADANTVALGDPAKWGHDGRKQLAGQDDVIKDLNLHVKHDLGWIFTQIDAGLNYSKRDKTRDILVYFANLNNGATTQLVSPSLLQSPVSLGFVGIPGVLSYNVNGVADKYYTMTQNMSGGPGGDLSKDFGVHEEIATYYAKADLETNVGPIPVRGNLGLQMVHTNQSSNANAFNPDGSIGGTIQPGTSYDDYLPSLNLVGDLGGGRNLRLGLAKTLARPRIDDMNASNSVSVSPTTHTWNGNGGNPLLQPWRARSLDLSFEQYLGRSSYVAAAAFLKKLDTYIYSQTIPYDFSGFTNPTPAIVPMSNMGTYSTQANGEGGRMNGLEFSTNLEGALFAPVLDGFGALLQAAFTNTSIQVGGPGNTPLWATLPGLSRKTAGATLYYEKYGYSVRINDRYRSDFRGEYDYLFGNRVTLRTLAQSQVDFQTSYEFQQGPAKGLSFLFQVLNLSNAADRNIQDGTGFGGAPAPQEYNVFGRSFLFGVNYKIH